MSSLDAGDVVERALAGAIRAGADAADALLVDSDELEARVRGRDIEFVKRSRERRLGIRALVRGARGLRSAVTSTSDLSPAAELLLSRGYRILQRTRMNLILEH